LAAGIANLLFGSKRDIVLTSRRPDVHVRNPSESHGRPATAFAPFDERRLASIPGDLAGWIREDAPLHATLMPRTFRIMIST
jgi:hypothetical protein